MGEPVAYPDIGLYHPRLKPRVTTQLKSLPQVADCRGTIGLLLLRTYILSGDTGHYDRVIAALETRGYRVVPVFCSGLDMRSAISRFMDVSEGGLKVDALCSLTGFSLVGGPAYSDAKAPPERWSSWISPISPPSLPNSSPGRPGRHRRRV